MINWLRPVCVVNAYVDSENVVHLSITPNFVKKHMNLVYMFKFENYTPVATYYFNMSNGDILVLNTLTGDVGTLQNDGTIVEREEA